MNQMPSSDAMVAGGMHAAATDAVLQPRAFVITPFTINVAQSALDDLKRRLEMTRWPTRETVSDWSQGVPLARVRALVDYWRTTYDWRRCEAMLNAFGQYRTEIEGLGIHFSSPHGGCLSTRDRRVLRECRRSDLAGGVAVAQQVRARPDLWPDRAVQRRGKG